MNFSTKVPRDHSEIDPVAKHADFTTPVFLSQEDEPSAESKVIALFDYQIRLYDYLIDRKRHANSKYKLKKEIARVEAEIMDRLKRMAYV